MDNPDASLSKEVIDRTDVSGQASMTIYHIRHELGILNPHWTDSTNKYSTFDDKW